MQAKEIIKIDNKIIKFFDNYVSKTNNRYHSTLSGIFRNDKRGELVATEGHKLAIIKTDSKLFLDLNNIFDSETARKREYPIFNFEGYRDITKKGVNVGFLHGSIYPCDNDLNILGDIVRECKDYFLPDGYNYPDYTYAIEYLNNKYLSDIYAIIKIKDFLNILKETYKPIKQHNKFCDKYSKIDIKQIVCKIVYSSEEKGFKLFLKDKLIFETDLNRFLVTSKPITKYITLSYLEDILKSFDVLGYKEVFFSDRVLFNTTNKDDQPKNLSPYCIFTGDTDNNIKSYLMPCRGDNYKK